MLRRIGPRLTQRRALCSGASKSPELADANLVESWLDDSSVVCDQLGFFSRLLLRTTLRTLPGLDLPDFLEGTKIAYPTVTRLMYSRDWTSLEPLVSQKMLDAMKQTMESVSLPQSLHLFHLLCSRDTYPLLTPWTFRFYRAQGGTI